MASLAKQKAEQLLATGVVEFSRGQINVTLSNLSVDANGTLWMNIDLVVSGQPVPLNNPFGFYNVPVTVPDGTTREEYDEYLGITRQVDNLIENHQEALIQMLYDAVTRQMDSGS